MLERYKQLEYENDKNIYFQEYEKNKVPQLIFTSTKTNFYDMTIDDFEMINYEPIKPQLKLELGI
jgi:thymidylate synthase